MYKNSKCRDEGLKNQMFNIMNALLRNCHAERLYFVFFKARNDSNEKYTN